MGIRLALIPPRNGLRASPEQISNVDVAYPTFLAERLELSCNGCHDFILPSPQTICISLPSSSLSLFTRQRTLRDRYRFERFGHIRKDAAQTPHASMPLLQKSNELLITQFKRGGSGKCIGAGSDRLVHELINSLGSGNGA